LGLHRWGEENGEFPAVHRFTDSPFFDTEKYGKGVTAPPLLQRIWQLFLQTSGVFFGRMSHRELGVFVERPSRQNGKINMR